MPGDTIIKNERGISCVFGGQELIPTDYSKVVGEAVGYFEGVFDNLENVKKIKKDGLLYKKLLRGGKRQFLFLENETHENLIMTLYKYSGKSGGVLSNFKDEYDLLLVLSFMVIDETVFNTLRAVGKDGINHSEMLHTYYGISSDGKVKKWISLPTEMNYEAKTVEKYFGWDIYESMMIDKDIEMINNFTDAAKLKLPKIGIEAVVEK